MSKKMRVTVDLAKKHLKYDDYSIEVYKADVAKLIIYIEDMTEQRKKLIDRIQSWLDTDPRKQIIAAVCANIAEEYAEELVKKIKL